MIRAFAVTHWFYCNCESYACLLCAEMTLCMPVTLSVILTPACKVNTIISDALVCVTASPVDHPWWQPCNSQFLIDLCLPCSRERSWTLYILAPKCSRDLLSVLTCSLYFIPLHNKCSRRQCPRYPFVFYCYVAVHVLFHVFQRIAQPSDSHRLLD